MKVMFFDTETGGLNPKKCSLLSVGMLRFNFDTGEIEDKAEMFVRLDSADDYVIEPKAFEVHGITAAECMEKGHPIEEVRDRMFDMWVGCEVAGGHNVGFDIDFLEEHMLDGEPFKTHFGYRILDTFGSILMLAGGQASPGNTLGQAIKGFKIDMSDIKGKFHGALFDTIATARVANHIRRLLTYAREQEKAGQLQI